MVLLGAFLLLWNVFAFSSCRSVCKWVLVRAAAVAVLTWIFATAVCGGRSTKQSISAAKPAKRGAFYLSGMNLDIIFLISWHLDIPSHLLPSWADQQDKDDNADNAKKSESDAEGQIDRQADEIQSKKRNNT